MKEELFDELLESVREGGAILRGDTPPSRRFEINAPDVRQIRQNTGLSQGDFALALGISPATLRNWEQNLRQPQGPARVLLTLVQKRPDLVFETIASVSNGTKVPPPRLAKPITRKREARPKQARA